MKIVIQSSNVYLKKAIEYVVLNNKNDMCKRCPYNDKTGKGCQRHIVITDFVSTSEYLSLTELPYPICKLICISDVPELENLFQRTTFSFDIQLIDISMKLEVISSKLSILLSENRRGKFTTNSTLRGRGVVRLSSTEKQVLDLTMNGHELSSIACMLGKNNKVVSNYRRVALIKLGINLSERSLRHFALLRKTKELTIYYDFRESMLT